MSKKVTAYSVMLMLLFSLSIALVSAQFKEGTCSNPSGGNYCGQKSKVSNCYCDKKCTQYKDCCIDYVGVCSSSVSGGGGNNISSINVSPIKEKCDPSICVPYICCDPKNRTCPLGFPSQCASCTKDICNSAEYKCNTDKDCPQITCAPCLQDPCPPCPQNSCVNGNCVLHTCGNGVCENGEAVDCICTPNQGPACGAPCLVGTCPSDCQVTQNIKCKDSDGGKNYFVKGVSSDYGTQNKVEDYCSNDTTLVEYSCTRKDSNGNLILNKEAYLCQNGCQNGACIKTNQITKQDVINWINNNCYAPSTVTDAITGSVIHKAPIIIQ